MDVTLGWIEKLHGSAGLKFWFMKMGALRPLGKVTKIVPNGKECAKD